MVGACGTSFETALTRLLRRRYQISRVDLMLRSER
jgi:hypothetical protein